jgi:hypothetical protein
MYNIFTQALVGTALLGSAFGAAVPALSKRAVWSPEVGSSYQIVITNILNIAAGLQPNVEVFDIDLFETPADTISQLHALGKKVICYFSAGTSEDWRPDWASFKEEDKGACLPQWPGERWLNVRSADVWSVMQSRIKLASDKGCDAIDPDNMGKRPTSAHTDSTN